MFYVLMSPLVTSFVDSWNLPIIFLHSKMNEVFNWECSIKMTQANQVFFFFFNTEDRCLNSKFHHSQFIIDNMQSVSGWVSPAAPTNVGKSWVSEHTFDFCWRDCLLWDLLPEQRQQLCDLLCSVPGEADNVCLSNGSWSHQDTHPIPSHRPGGAWQNPWMRGPDPESHSEPFEV